MVLISQIWIQHLPCTLTIGYAYLRIGSDVDPDLACPLYHALVTAFVELQKDEDAGEFSHLSGVYSYRLHQQGLGLLTMQNQEFRVVLLIEGFTGRGIPHLTGEVLKKVRDLLDYLRTIITKEDCKLGHSTTDFDESFWWHLIVSHGLGQLQIEDAITKIFPLRFNRIQFTPNVGENGYLQIRTMEDTQQSLGPGFIELDDLITQKILLVYNRPQETFQLYHSLFQQMEEFAADFPPSSLILTFHKSGISDYSDMTSVLVILLAVTPEELTLQFGVPLGGLYPDRTRAIHSLLQEIAPPL